VIIITRLPWPCPRLASSHHRRHPIITNTTILRPLPSDIIRIIILHSVGYQIEELRKYFLHGHFS
jgi:hypothetical protein